MAEEKTSAGSAAPERAKQEPEIRDPKPAPLAVRTDYGAMKALTPAHPHLGLRVAPLTPPRLPDIPSSTTQAVRRSLCQSPQRRRLFRASPRNRRLATGSRRIRFVLLRTAGSSPVALHLASRRRSYFRLPGLRPARARTSTVLTKRPHGRTIPAFAGMTSRETLRSRSKTKASLGGATALDSPGKALESLGFRGKEKVIFGRIVKLLEGPAENSLETF
jgi:hypothetical protein